MRLVKPSTEGRRNEDPRPPSASLSSSWNVTSREQGFTLLCKPLNFPRTLGDDLCPWVPWNPPAWSRMCAVPGAGSLKPGAHVFAGRPRPLRLHERWSNHGGSARDPALPLTAAEKPVAPARSAGFALIFLVSP